MPVHGTIADLSVSKNLNVLLLLFFSEKMICPTVEPRWLCGSFRHCAHKAWQSLHVKYKLHRQRLELLSPEEEKKLKVLKLTYEVALSVGEKMPDEASMTPGRWVQVLLGTSPARKRWGIFPLFCRSYFLEGNIVWRVNVWSGLATMKGFVFLLFVDRCLTILDRCMTIHVLFSFAQAQDNLNVSRKRQVNMNKFCQKCKCWKDKNRIVHKCQTWEQYCKIPHLRTPFDVQKIMPKRGARSFSWGFDSWYHW